MKTENRSQRSAVRGQRSAFTLIELLTVIVIISILVALLFPALKTAIAKSEQTSTKARIARVVSGYHNWKAEIGGWPCLTTNPVPLVAEAVDRLTGRAATASGAWVGNPRGIAYLDPAAKDINSVGSLVDDWGKALHAVFDVAGTGQIVDPFPTMVIVSCAPPVGCVTTNFVHQAIPATVLVISAGPDGLMDYNDTAAAVKANADNIVSWK